MLDSRPSLRCRALFFVLVCVLAAPLAGGGLPGVTLTPVVGQGGVTSITHAGDERLFVTLQSGTIRILEGGTFRPAPFLDLSALVGSGFEQGLLSVAFHPDYASGGTFFVYYTDTDDDTVVARYQVSAGDPDVADPASAAVLIQLLQPSGSHYGGQVVFGPDGYLYVTLGDGGGQQDPSCRGQRLDVLQGKVLRLDVDQNVGTPPYYGIPAANPFVGPSDPFDEVFALGLRNPWRMSFDRATGSLYLSDVGQFQREEVNVVPAFSNGGQNFGWKVMEGTSCFAPMDPSCPPDTPPCDDPSFTPPVIEYDHSGGECSITGGYVYRGRRAAELTGWYVYGDWCTGRMWASRVVGGVVETVLLPITAGNLQTLGEGVDGELYVATPSGISQITSTIGIFADGFTGGDTGAWTFGVP